MYTRRQPIERTWKGSGMAEGANTLAICVNGNLRNILKNAMGKNKFKNIFKELIFL